MSVAAVLYGRGAGGHRQGFGVLKATVGFKGMEADRELTDMRNSVSFFVELKIET